MTPTKLHVMVQLFDMNYDSHSVTEIMLKILIMLTRVGDKIINGKMSAYQICTHKMHYDGQIKNYSLGMPTNNRRFQETF